MCLGRCVRISPGEPSERHRARCVGQNHRIVHRAVGVSAAVALGEGTLGRPDLDLRAPPADASRRQLIAAHAHFGIRRGQSITHQLLLMSPTGTLPTGDSFCDKDLPKSQHTAENVEKRVWPGEKFWLMV